jgi:predicted nucleic acid-binding protein
LNYLLDTNVISEALRPKPNRNVARWLETLPEEWFYLSVLTLGEIRKGVELLPASKRKERARAWLDTDLVTRFQDRVLDVDAAVCDRWGYLVARRKRPVPAIDSLLAATALTHDLVLLTRNAKDFDFEGLRVVDPFGAKAPS